MTKKSLSEKEVEQFLLLNPDFLSKNSHILNALEIVHETGGAVSLIQKQVELLRLARKYIQLTSAGISFYSPEGNIYKRFV